MSTTTPGSSSPSRDAEEMGANAASLAGIKIRPSRQAEAAAPARKAGDITLLLSRVSDKPRLAAPVAPGAGPQGRPIALAAPGAPKAAAPEATAEFAEPAEPAAEIAAGPIDATMRESAIDADFSPAGETGDGDPRAGASEEPEVFDKPGDRRHYDALGRRVSDIQGYWARLRDGRRWPSWRDLDAALITQIWPNSFLLACDGGGRDGRAPVVVQAARIGQATPVPGSADDVPITHAMTEWIRSVGAEVAASGLPARETDSFETARGSMRLRLHALPLSNDEERVECVLCHVARAPG